MKLILFFLILSPLTYASQTSTNIQITTSQSTNAVDVNRKLTSVLNALPSFYSIELDANGVKTITQLSDELLESSSINDLNFEVSTSVFPGDVSPVEVYFHFLSHSVTGAGHYFDADTQPEFAISFDTNSISFGKLEATSQSEIDNSIVDLYSASLTMEQFRQVAWANKVFCHLGRKTFEISYSSRQKWKLLWNYFDLLDAHKRLSMAKQ